MAFGVAEAGEMTGLSRTFLYDQMKEGQLKTIKVAGRRLILKKDLVAFLESFQTEEA
jgi:excisionase family DNA binding protein